MKTKLRSRLTSMLLVLVMVLALVPLSVFSVAATEPEVTEVGTFEELLNAVNADKTHIKLKHSITDTVPDDELPSKHRLVFDGDKDYILDLNGNKLEVLNHANEFYGGNFSMIEVSNDSSLEIKNGSITFENYYGGHTRIAKGVLFVTDTSAVTATDVDMKNPYIGTTVHATDDARITLNGGTYSAFNGFAVYLERRAALTLDEGVYLYTEVGDAVATVHIDGYGALYSESTGEMTVNYASFRSGVQVHLSQITAFDTATHELVLNGVKQSEDVANIQNSFDAKQAGKDYYWYGSGATRCIYKTEGGFSNEISVISYQKTYPIEIEFGIATVGGAPVTEASYGQVVNVVSNPPEAGKEFVMWGTNGVEVADYNAASTSFTMSAA
ncbi:MAG: hypothetical protein IJW16_08260, partial [Clostridia bacterium]|nr:hypothetical protein [Clostridia bacterium]